MATFCKSCQTNGVNTRVEWRPNPDKPGKKKQFDIDKNEWHKCPYWKPDPNYKAKLKPEDREVFDNFEKEQSVQVETGKQYTNNDIMNAINVFQIDISKRLSTLERTVGELGEALAKMSFKPASELK